MGFWKRILSVATLSTVSALSIGAALGVTFPFNLLLGIPLYHDMAERLNGVFQ